jgi:DNA polymerase
MVDIIIDFETRSRLSLGDTNSYKYAQHSSTEVLCMSYCEPFGDVELWTPADGGWPFDDYGDHLRFWAFNAEFELNIWNYVCVPKYGWPALIPSQIYCLAARASYAGLPRKLATCCTTLGLGRHGKDEEGNAVMKRLCRPQRAAGHGKVTQIGCEFFGGAFDETPEKHRRNEAYCIQDTRAERLVQILVPELPDFERRLWLAHQEINERGVPVDIDLCRNACQMVEWEREELCKELQALTGNKVRTPNCIAKMGEWLAEQGASNVPNMQEDVVRAALKGQMGELNDAVKRALEIRLLYRDASVAKYEAMVCHANNDDRCQGAHVYHKAGPGRFQGQGVNFLNMRRLDENRIDEFVMMADAIADPGNDLLWSYNNLRATKEGVIPYLGQMVRMAVCAPPGYKLAVCDYSSIEMRMLHWLAGDELMLKQIRDYDNGKGEEPYKLGAAEITGKKLSEITKSDRQLGKVQKLGCGYMQGGEKLQAFAEDSYGVVMTLDRATEIVQLYRRSHPKVVGFWYALGKAATKTIKTRRPHSLEFVEFYMVGSNLVCRLPSGREMTYYNAKVVQGVYGDELEAVTVTNGLRRVVGLPILVENVDQGTSRDLLADALLKCRAEGLPVVLHVYDEIVLCIKEDDDKSGARLRDIMRDPPSWARGLPVDAKLGEHRRYTK